MVWIVILGSQNFMKNEASESGFYICLLSEINHCNFSNLRGESDEKLLKIEFWILRK